MMANIETKSKEYRRIAKRQEKRARKEARRALKRSADKQS
jgi:hypothetical protein